METQNTYVNKVYDLLLERIDQLNNKSNKPVYGKAAEYRELLTTCQFKLVIWWKVKKDNTPYSIYELQQNRNRVYLPSFDTVAGPGGVPITDHENAHELHITYCIQNLERINKAIMIWNNYGDSEEWMIFNLNPDNVKASRYVQPDFRTDALGGKYCRGMLSRPLRIDKMRFTE